MSSIYRRSLAALTGMLCLSAAQAQQNSLDTMTVTATRTHTEVRNFGGSITVLTEDDLEKLQQPTISDVLRTVPGVDVVQRGGLGKQTSVFMRGTESNHTLVLVDGVEINDPSDPTGAFDFSNLQLANVERIEILRGPQSTLYGSDAIGGVIQIITKEGEGEPVVTGGASIGQFETHQSDVGVRGAYQALSYSANISHLESDGISAADEDNGHTEEDGYRNTTFSSRLGLEVTDWLNLTGNLRYLDTKSEIDGFNADDPDRFQENEELYTKLQANVKLLSGHWQQRLSLAHTDIERFNSNGPLGPPSFGSPTSTFEGRRTEIEWLHDLYLPFGHQATIGLETDEESVDTSAGLDRDVRTDSVFVQDQWQFAKRFTLIGGLRHDDNELFGSETTWRVAGSADIPEFGLVFRGSASTGFNAPTLSELFGSFSGNPNLDAEESEGWELGFDYTSRTLPFSAGYTYFRNDIDNLITAIQVAPFTFQNVNIDRADIKGHELYAQLKPVSALRLRAEYTYTEAIDEATGNQLLLRPEHKATFTADYSIMKDANVLMNIFYVGERNDFGTSLEEYTLVNLTASYQVNPQITLQARMDNVFDEDYQQSATYGARGRSLYGGFRFKF